MYESLSALELKLIRDLHLEYDPDHSKMVLSIRDNYDKAVIDMSWRMDDLAIPTLFEAVLGLAQEYVRLDEVS